MPRLLRDWPDLASAFTTYLLSHCLETEFCIYRSLSDALSNACKNPLAARECPRGRWSLRSHSGRQVRQAGGHGWHDPATRELFPEQIPQAWFDRLRRGIKSGSDRRACHTASNGQQTCRRSRQFVSKLETAVVDRGPFGCHIMDSMCVAHDLTSTRRPFIRGFGPCAARQWHAKVARPSPGFGRRERHAATGSGLVEEIFAC